jgi:hypothetical protein
MTDLAELKCQKIHRKPDGKYKGISEAK